MLLSPGLCAQASIALTSASPISVLTSDSAGVSTFGTVAQNQPIGYWPNAVSLSTSQYPNGKSLFASTSIYPTQSYQGGIGLNYFEHAACRGVPGDFAGSSASAGQTGATLGAHSVLATFSAAPGTAGEFRITLLANAGTNGTAFASVDVGNDNVVEYAQGNTGSFVIPYTFGPSGQEIVRIDNECNVPGVNLSLYNRGYSEISVWFMPNLTATCNITPYGQGCNGVQASGLDVVTGNTRTISVLGTGCYTNGPVIVASGSQQISLPLPLGCALLSNAEGVSLVTADAAGNATVTWQIPATLIGTTNVQMLPITVIGGNLTLSASNGVEIHCFR
ncbi:MAG: hypothetical protein KDC48_00640 [Planctomycetes bacterium]|nr:hypothetical protein [Planctomycetota bacterium]